MRDLTRNFVERKSKAAESSAACGGCSETQQGPRSQSASVLQRAPHDAGTATRTNAED